MGPARSRGFRRHIAGFMPGGTLAPRPSPSYLPPMCNAYNLRHRNEAILDIARAMQLAVSDLPEFPPQHRIGIKQQGLILRPNGHGPLAWSWARWSLIPPGQTSSRPIRSTMPALTSSSVAVESRPAPALHRPGERLWEPEKPARRRASLLVLR